MSAPVDVLAELRALHVRTNGAAMSEHDGSLARIDDAIEAFAELIAAASAGTPEAGVRAVSAGLWFGPHRAERLRIALARVTGAPA